VTDLDLQLLNDTIDQLPVEEIRERRRNFNVLYEEAMISADERGISFTAMLLMLAHYKFIDDNRALRYLRLLLFLTLAWMIFSGVGQSW
jgi:voltage-dependent calcium channel